MAKSSHAPFGGVKQRCRRPEGLGYGEELDLDPEKWRDEMVSLEALDKEIPELAFADVLKDADQFHDELGRKMSDELGLPPRTR